MNSFKISYDHLKEEMGILFIQLKPNNAFSKKVRIYDVSGHEHAIDLNSVNFVLQKKADQMIYPHLDYLKTEKEWKEAFFKVLSLMAVRIEKGIMDDDLNIEVNVGFRENEPFIIDGGRFFLVSDLNFAKELEKSTRFLHDWLEEKHPEMAETFKEMRSAWRPTSESSQNASL